MRTHEKEVVKRTFGPEKGAGKSRNEAIKLYCSPNIVTSDKLRRTNLAEYETHKKET
jgi:hypothetical protein